MNNDINGLEARRNTLINYGEKLFYAIQELNSKTREMSDSIRIQRLAVEEVSSFSPGNTGVRVTFITDSFDRSEICIDSGKTRKGFLKKSGCILKRLRRELAEAEIEKRIMLCLYLETIEGVNRVNKLLDFPKLVRKELISELFPGYSEDDLEVLYNLPEQDPPVEEIQKEKKNNDSMFPCSFPEQVDAEMDAKEGKKGKLLRGCSPNLKYTIEMFAYTYFLIEYVNRGSKRCKMNSYEGTVHKFFPEVDVVDLLDAGKSFSRSYNEFMKELNNLSKPSKEKQLKIMKKYGELKFEGKDTRKIKQALHSN